MGWERDRATWSILLAFTFLLAGCGVDSRIEDRLDDVHVSLNAKRVVSTAIREGRCKDARAVALAVSDGDLAEKVAATCKPEPSRRGFPTDPAAAEIDVLRDASSLARDRAPDWRYLPSLDVIQFFYPKAARKADIEGRVTVQCRLDVEGTPHDCGIVSETPVGHGFGAAALKVANLCEFLPARMNGEAVASTVRIPISFRISD